MELELNSSNFEKEVLQSGKTVLVDFWATWCPPCKILNPILEDVSKDLEGEVSVGKVDIDANSELAQKYEVVNIPTMILFKNGVAVNKLIGAFPKEKIINFIRSN